MTAMSFYTLQKTKYRDRTYQNFRRLITIKLKNINLRSSQAMLVLLKTESVDRSLSSELKITVK
jgi:hypothetical protein